MPILSIVIPVQGSVDALERSLVSVLEHRPADSEIIVVLNTSYDDPYDLTDEVRFVTAGAGASWSECVAIGIAASCGTIVHLLAAGAEVGQHWSHSLLGHFRDANVWAVAGASYDRCQGERLLNAGIDATPAADRISAGGQLSDQRVLGPAWWGGSYRRSMLETTEAAFDSPLPATVATSHLAWRQALAGRRCAFDPQLRIYVPKSWTQPSWGIRDGYHTERLFWQRRADRERRPSIAAHLVLLLALLLGGFLRPRQWLHLAGKCLAWPSIASCRRQGARTVAANQPRESGDLGRPPHLLKPSTVVAGRMRGRSSLAQ